MVQMRDYLETLFRPGDCVVCSRNLLKYLKNKWWKRRESNPPPALYTRRSQAPGKKMGNLREFNSQNIILKDYSLSQHIHHTSWYFKNHSQPSMDRNHQSLMPCLWNKPFIADKPTRLELATSGVTVLS